MSREDAVFAVAYNYRMNDTEDIDPVACFDFDKSGVSLDESEFESGNITDDSPENNPQDGFDDGIVSREDILFVLTNKYKKSAAEKIDPIINFDPDKSVIGLDASELGIQNLEGLSIGTTRKNKNLSKLKKSDKDLIYDRDNGCLYLNANGEDNGLGNNGGLIAVLQPRIDLASSNFELLA